MTVRSLISRKTEIMTLKKKRKVGYCLQTILYFLVTKNKEKFKLFVLHDLQNITKNV